MCVIENERQSKQSKPCHPLYLSQFNISFHCSLVTPQNASTERMHSIAISPQKLNSIPQSSRDPSASSPRHHKPKNSPSLPAMQKQKLIAPRSCRISAVVVAATGHSSRPGGGDSRPRCSCRRAGAGLFVRSPGCRTEMRGVYRRSVGRW